MSAKIDIAGFIKRSIDSFEKWDILNYYCRQPSAFETVNGLSLLTGKNPEAIRAAIEDFISDGILYTIESDADLSYRISPENAGMFEQFKHSMDDRSSRLKLFMLALDSIRNSNMIEEGKEVPVNA